MGLTTRNTLQDALLLENNVFQRGQQGLFSCVHKSANPLHVI